MHDLWTVNLGTGGVLFLIGLVWVRRAYVGEKAVGVTTLSSPPLLMSHRDRKFALLTGIFNMAAGLLNIWIGLRHSG
jgi:hypothetical protein